MIALNDQLIVIDIEPLLESALGALNRAGVGAGRYRRQLGPELVGHQHVACGTAAAASILYTLDRLPTDEVDRQAFVTALRQGQSPETGMFSDPDQHPVHATAMRVAALTLFDARPRYPLTGLRQLLTADTVERTLESLDWVRAPWEGSHIGAGSFAALHIVDELPPGAADRYFDWLWRNQDPYTGLWRQGCQPGQAVDSAPLFHHVAGSAHYLFNHVAAGRPWPYPDVMIDTALRMYADGAVPLGRQPGFAEIDWIYCLTRSAWQCGHRVGEVEDLLRAFAFRYVRNLRDVVFDDLHELQGTLAALAELQHALPGELPSARPLRLTLDRRPFL